MLQRLLRLHSTFVAVIVSIVGVTRRFDRFSFLLLFSGALQSRGRILTTEFSDANLGSYEHLRHCPRCRPYMSVTLPKGTPLEDGVGADPSKFQKAVKVADKLGERIARTTDKIMEMRQDIDGKQVL